MVHVASAAIGAEGHDAGHCLRPDFMSASLMIHCSCPCTERNSSAAHRSSEAMVSASRRRRKVFVFDDVIARFLSLLIK